jgi:hypothetical protein
MISIIGILRSERAFEVRSVMRLETRTPSFSSRASGLTAELRDESGSALAQAPLQMLSSWADDDGCQCHKQNASANQFPCIVQALLPDIRRGAVLAIGDGERDLWVRAANEQGPHIRSFQASFHEDRLAVTWSVETRVNAAEMWLQWSSDDGKTWNGLATGLTGERGEFDGSYLPAGTVTLRLLVSDGFDTSISDPATIHVPQRQPIVSILAPQEGETLRSGGTLRAWGAATIDGRPAVSVETARWLLDGQPVAEGFDAFIPAPTAGEHVIELIVTADELTGTRSHRFSTVPTGQAKAHSVKGANINRRS